ncbi:hypothetical protein AB1Y20_008992 [Prymnesium parvum]|uniref:Uncharacterized protein n=1 Tax=Prymnesium parvum TaxID=97485 RepID=A0AB34K3K7_PRYPA
MSLSPARGSIMNRARGASIALWKRDGASGGVHHVDVDHSISVGSTTQTTGMLFTDAFFAYRYFVDKDAEFTVEMSKLAYCLMHNDFLPKKAASPQSQPSVGRGSPQSCVDCDVEHELIPLEYVEGFEGYRQQRCIMCNKPTSLWCCRACTTGPLCLVPLCPKETLGSQSQSDGSDAGEEFGAVDELAEDDMDE